MITLVCFTLLSILTIRSLLLMLVESKSPGLRFADFLLALLFGATAYAIVLFTGFNPFQDLPLTLISFILLGMVVGLSMLLRLRKPYESRPLLFTLKFLLTLLILFVSVVVIMTSGFIHIAEDRPLLKITMTGMQKKEQVEWKSPNRELRNEDLTAYEVVLAKPDGKLISSFYMYGDQVAIKARVIRFRPILNVAGLSNLCRIEFVFNGYTTAERHNAYPHLAQTVSMEPLLLKPFQKRFWDFWENIYYLRGKSWWVKSATLESAFFPLVQPDGSPFQGSYYLTITPGGLSSAPASE
jgi:hypothetical protein